MLNYRILLSVSATKGGQKQQTFHLVRFVRPMVDDTQGLCNSRQSFVLRQPIQSIQGSLYFALPFPEQLPNEFLCDTLSITNVYLIGAPCTH